MNEGQFIKGAFVGLLGLIGAGVLPMAASAATPAVISEKIYEGRTLGDVSLPSALASVRAGSVVVLGEQHAHLAHQNEQLQVIETLQKNGHLVSVGMEFFTYTEQGAVDDWRAGKLSEPDFLAKIKWGGGFSFDFYRAQVTRPRIGHEYVWALNAPMSLTGKVAKGGLGSLTAEELRILPPQFHIGNARYLERFQEAMGGHVPPGALQNYFTAQSIWDDTMAWRAVEFLKAHPEQVLVIIVGEFHVQYGGGLPDRLRARGVRDVTTFSLVNIEGMNPDEERAAISPSTVDGPRASFIWASRP